MLAVPVDQDAVRDLVGPHPVGDHGRVDLLCRAQVPGLHFAPHHGERLPRLPALFDRAAGRNHEVEMEDVSGPLLDHALKHLPPRITLERSEHREQLPRLQLLPPCSVLRLLGRAVVGWRKGRKFPHPAPLRRTLHCQHTRKRFP
eukprot:767048-Hanusia_phi.AAC.2